MIEMMMIMMILLMMMMFMMMIKMKAMTRMRMRMRMKKMFSSLFFLIRNGNMQHVVVVTNRIIHGVMNIDPRE
jgi:hypothetical protein